MKSIPISVVINTKNSASTLERCLKSVAWAADIVVVDSGSTDNTIEIAKKYTDSIHLFEKEINFVEPARNFAISKTKHEWVLIVDADEEVSEGLKKKIPELTDSDIDAWDIPRKNIVFGKWIQYTGWWPDLQRRLFKKNAVKWSDKIHSIPEVTGKIGKLTAKGSHALIHHNYQSIEQYIERLNKYTSIEASQSDAAPSSARTIKEGFAEFQKRYYKLEGYKDQYHGLSLSLLQMFYQVAVQLKIWQKHNFKNAPDVVEDTIGGIIKELRYWQHMHAYKISKNPIRKLYLKIRMKLKI